LIWSFAPVDFQTGVILCSNVVVIIENSDVTRKVWMTRSIYFPVTLNVKDQELLPIMYIRKRYGMCAVVVLLSQCRHHFIVSFHDSKFWRHKNITYVTHLFRFYHQKPPQRKLRIVHHFWALRRHNHRWPPIRRFKHCIIIIVTKYITLIRLDF
jgi:hypothetical protein